MATPLTDRILETARRIPEGSTASYAELALMATGSPRRARAVGQALRGCASDVPWWRVVHADGTLAGVKDPLQARLLRAEGVRIGLRRGRPAVMQSSR